MIYKGIYRDCIGIDRGNGQENGSSFRLLGLGLGLKGYSLEFV